MIRNLVLFLFAGCLTLTACQEEASTWDPSYQKVMDVHDEVMPKIKDIVSAQGTLEKMDTTQLDKGNKELYTITQKLLLDAEEGMFSWMDQLKNKKALRALPDAEVEAYLADEMINVKKVRFDMINSLDAFKAFQDKITKEK